jgi:hypothetical protein
VPVTSKLVEVANAISSDVRRQINWMDSEVAKSAMNQPSLQVTDSLWFKVTLSREKYHDGEEFQGEMAAFVLASIVVQKFAQIC